MGRDLRIARAAGAPAPRRGVHLVAAGLAYLVSYDSAPAPGKVDTDTAQAATLEASF